MKVTIEINGDNAAFYNENETINHEEYRRILEHLADVLEHYLDEPQRVSLRDANGNKCGYIEVDAD